MVQNFNKLACTSVVKTLENGQARKDVFQMTGETPNLSLPCVLIREVTFAVTDKWRGIDLYALALKFLFL